MRRVASAILVSAGLLAALPAQATEADFLQTLEGNWSGGGSIRLKPEEEPVNVNCELASDAAAERLSMDGNCNAMIVMSRAIGADLSVDGETYSGTYTGSPRGPASLSGNRSGDTVNLAVAWPETGREASMQLSSSGNALQIVTTEAHPETGEPVITAQLSFERQ
jgi:hypothetical protein